MTNERILAVCRSNWEYRGIDDAAVREMLAELAAHLEDAAAAGRAPRDVVGDDVPAFAASWARAHRPLYRRALRMAALVPLVAGLLLLLVHLRRWSPAVDVTPGPLAFWVALAAATVLLELRRGSLGLGRTWVVGLVVGLPAAVLTERVVGEGTLFSVPLWLTVLVMLPGLVYAVAEHRAAKNRPAAESPAG
ncbi:hypothetical protein EAO71_26215 [Streptomyces sp. ms191]|uniref:hypothetical protein n=1 Tax=Streptomyces sp. ms191 TaxID=1827978 RepID=UPI0011CD6658|nr:hypothetical protein [Streptomyces sp. ms191]TXS21994.1 hypothetical protein EAO71_26215 [Streptomyces sp. ms191]